MAKQESGPIDVDAYLLKLRGYCKRVYEDKALSRGVRQMAEVVGLVVDVLEDFEVRLCKLEASMRIGGGRT